MLPTGLHPFPLPSRATGYPPTMTPTWALCVPGLASVSRPQRPPGCTPQDAELRRAPAPPALLCEQLRLGEESPPAKERCPTAFRIIPMLTSQETTSPTVSLSPFLRKPKCNTSLFYSEHKLLLGAPGKRGNTMRKRRG